MSDPDDRMAVLKRLIQIAHEFNLSSEDIEADINLMNEPVEELEPSGEPKSQSTSDQE